MRHRKIIGSTLGLIVVGTLVVSKVTLGNVVCSSQFGPCAKGISEFADGLAGQGLLQSRSRLVAFLSTNPLVSDYSIDFVVPRGFKINVVERSGYVALGKFGQDEYLVSDRNGLVIKKDRATALPILFVDGQLPDIGERLSDDYYFAAGILDTLNASYATHVGMVKGDSLEVTILESVDVIFPLSGDNQVLIGSLRFLLSRLKPTASGSTIDLRYKNPVIR